MKMTRRLATIFVVAFILLIYPIPYTTAQTYVDRLTLPAPENHVRRSLVDVASGFAYFAIDEPPSVVRVRLPDFSRNQTIQATWTGPAWYDDSAISGTPTPISAAANSGYAFSLWTATPTSGTITITTPSSSSTTTTIYGTGTITAGFTSVSTVVTLNAISPQYYTRGSTVSYSGTVSPAGPGTTVGIVVKDRFGVTIWADTLTPTGEVFSSSFLIGLTGAEGLCTIYASSGDGHAQAGFYLDISAPTSSVSVPANGVTVPLVSTISGIASDPNLADGNLGSGVSSVMITIQRVTGGLYWTGSAWGSLTWLAVSYSAGSWNYAGASGVSWTTGSYTIVSKATDVAGNVQTPGAGNTFYLDMNEYTLTVISSPTEGGSVTKNPNNPHYHYGDVVQLTANPATGWSFSVWGGDLSGSVNPASIVMSGNRAVTATFKASAGQYAAKITSTSLVPDPANVGRGSKMIFTITVRNTGSSDISLAKVQVKIHGSDGRLASRALNFTSFVAGTERTIQIYYPLPVSAPLGVWTYDVYLFRLATPSKFMLLDKLLGQPFTVQAPIKSGDITSVTDSPDPVARGGKATFTVKLKDTGNIVWSTAKITVKIYKPDGTLAGTRYLTISNIMPNVENSYDITWLVASYLKAGTYKYDVTLNYGTILIDSHKGNTIQVN